MKKLLVLLLFELFNSYNSIAQLTVADLLGLKQSISSLLTEANNIVDRQRQQVFIDLSAIVSYSFDRLEGTLDKTERILTKKERAIYSELDKLLLKARNAINEQRIELFNDLDQSLGNAIAELPFTSNNPYPTKVKMPFVGENSNGSFRVKVKGVKLNNTNNYASLNGIKSLKTIITSKSEIIFEIPINRDSLNIGSNNILRVVLFKGKKKQFNFEVPFRVYPIKFAEIVFYYTYTKDVISTSNHSQIKDLRSPDNCDWSYASTNIGRVNQGNWNIDVNSVSVAKITGAPGGSECSIESKTPALIGAKVSARSNCGGRRRFDPEVGITTCQYSWTEMLSTPTEFNEEMSISLSYNESRALTDFPNGITRFRKAVIKYYNGQIFEFTDNAYNNGFISYSYDGSRESFQVQSAFQDFGDGY